MGVVKARRYCPEDDRMVLAEKQTPNHVLHLILIIVTLGFWIIVWIILILGADLGAYRCPYCGSKTRSRPPRGWKPRRLREEEEDDDDY